MAHERCLPAIGEEKEQYLSNQALQTFESHLSRVKEHLEDRCLPPRSRFDSVGCLNDTSSSAVGGSKRARSFSASVKATTTISRSQTETSSLQDKFARLQNLQELLQQGFISPTEFKSRRLQLVDELTGTKSRSKSSVDHIPRPIAPIVYHPPPSFDHIAPENAIKHEFDYESRKWSTSRIRVKLDESPFAKGGLRMVYHLQDLSMDPNKRLVAKISIDPHEDDETYFKDVEMQAVAADYARLFNRYTPPRIVEFVQAWILQLVDRGDLVCGVEPFIQGDYRKHNNNCGYVSDLDRNTPQAFSHFTFEASNHEILVVDIQGVRDHYTDPQIHTRRGEEFGKGNLSMRGFKKFLSSHRCNPICRYLKLPLINPKESQGTVPQQTYMNHPRVALVESELRHYYGKSPLIRNTTPRDVGWCGGCMVQ